MLSRFEWNFQKKKQKKKRNKRKYYLCDGWCLSDSFCFSDLSLRDLLRLHRQVGLGLSDTYREFLKSERFCSFASPDWRLWRRDRVPPRSYFVMGIKSEALWATHLLASVSYLGVQCNFICLGPSNHGPTWTFINKLWNSERDAVWTPSCSACFKKCWTMWGLCYSNLQWGSERLQRQLPKAFCWWQLQFLSAGEYVISWMDFLFSDMGTWGCEASVRGNHVAWTGRHAHRAQTHTHCDTHTHTHAFQGACRVCSVLGILSALLGAEVKAGPRRQVPIACGNRICIWHLYTCAALLCSPWCTHLQTPEDQQIYEQSQSWPKSLQNNPITLTLFSFVIIFVTLTENYYQKISLQCCCHWFDPVAREHAKDFAF